MGANRWTGRRGILGASVLAVAAVAVFIVVNGGEGPPADPSPPPPAGSGTFKGSPDAPITIIEYADFQCHFCQSFARTTEREMDRAYIQTGKVRIEYRHFVIFGEESVQAALASECAAEQDRFWPYHDLLMATEPDPQVRDLTSGKLKDLARALGLDQDGFDSCLDSQRYRDKVDRDVEEGRAAGVEATPSFIIGGKRIRGAQSFSTFQGIIDGLLADSGN
ncbi:MAG: DsbA family protein [Dehalococcoidia bacterium]